MPENGDRRELHPECNKNFTFCAVFEFTDFARFDDRGLCAELDLRDCAIGRIRAIQAGIITPRGNAVRLGQAQRKSLDKCTSNQVELLAMCMASLTVEVATKSVNAPVAQFGDITHVAQTTLISTVAMSPSIASPITPSSSRSSSPSSSVGVYVPIHRRTPSLSSSRSSSTEPECAFHLVVPRSYTPEELLQLAQSPLAKQLVAVMYEPVRSFSEIAISRRRQRSRKYFARTPTSKVPAIVAVPAASTPTHGLPSRGAVNRRHASPKNANGPGWRCQL
ncbi:hypothetical protein B0H11DRAFT_1930643 [Mycena galericulata]|nr:hypothetical protein B0H11DRAFT_1930643 [Mycena galericulata]